MNKAIRFLKYNRIRILQIILAFLVVIIIFASVWIATPYKASTNAITNLVSTDTFDYLDSGNLEFIPKDAKKNGVIFYPGGRVEAQAYSYICKEIATNGYPCIIAVMPLNLAVFKINAASEIISKFDKVESWVIGGHSLGGSMAARYVKDNPNKINGIFFLASYSDVDLSKTNLKALTIVGTEDSVLNAQAYKDNYSNFPEDRSINVIQGGNHSQFGDYGLQDGDLEPQIEVSDQHNIVVAEILKLLN